MSRIELSHIDKFFGNNHVLKDLDLVIEDGDFMTLLGPSGCGKTTTLRVVAGLEKPQNGYMTIDGMEAINADKAFYLEPSKRGLNLVFQSYALWPHMTVYENIAYSMKIKHMDKATIDKKVKAALAAVRISEFEKRYPSELSGGQQQRVAIARAIASDPKLLLLDEPLSNLDAKLRIDMRSELKRLHLDTGTTIIYVTHDQVEALTMSTKIAVFDKGRLAQVAPPVELYMNPADLVVADFIGNPRVNFIPAKAKQVSGDLVVDSELGTIKFPAVDVVKGAEIPNGEFEAVIGLRPEHVDVRTENFDGAIEASVFTVQFAGSESIVTLRVGKDEFLAKMIGLVELKEDQKVYLNIDPRKLNVFNKETTKLIKRTHIG